MEPDLTVTSAPLTESEFEDYQTYRERVPGLTGWTQNEADAAAESEETTDEAKKKRMILKLILAFLKLLGF